MSFTKMRLPGERGRRPGGAVGDGVRAQRLESSRAAPRHYQLRIVLQHEHQAAGPHDRCVAALARARRPERLAGLRIGPEELPAVGRRHREHGITHQYGIAERQRQLRVLPGFFRRPLIVALRDRVRGQRLSLSRHDRPCCPRRPSGVIALVTARDWTGRLPEQLPFGRIHADEVVSREDDHLTRAGEVGDDRRAVPGASPVQLHFTAPLAAELPKRGQRALLVAAHVQDHHTAIDQRRLRRVRYSGSVGPSALPTESCRLAASNAVTIPLMPSVNSRPSL